MFRRLIVITSVVSDVGGLIMVGANAPKKTLKFKALDWQKTLPFRIKFVIYTYKIGRKMDIVQIVQTD